MNIPGSWPDNTYAKIINIPFFISILSCIFAHTATYPEEMKQYTDISNAYRGCEITFFFIEGKKDKALNRYVRGHLKSIEKHLAQRGVHYAAFNIVSTSFFGMRSVKNLVLRANPTLNKEELQIRVKEFKENIKPCGRSRLLYISSVTRTGNGSYMADILCEEDFNKDGDYITALYKFLDTVVRLDIARDCTPKPNNGYKFKLTDTTFDDEVPWDNSEYLACDLLSAEMTADANATVSPIRFDSDFNISLPLYPQITIKLAPLPKALYILFLKHPEGIVLKDIQEHESELRSIYGAVSGRKNPTVLNKMFKTLTNPLVNPLHKNISIIRRSFLSRLRSDIAQNYIPAHGRTRAHNIPIDASLVEMPDIA